MELFRGKGVLFLFSRFSSFFQISQNFTFSKLFSLFTLLFGFVLLFL